MNDKAPLGTGVLTKQSVSKFQNDRELLIVGTI